MNQKYIFALQDFSLGQNDKDAPNLIQDNALVEAQNAIVGKGFVSKRHGYQAYTNTPEVQRAIVWSDIGFKKWSEV